jgi:DNA-binding beta-propeller fold protein YncE
MRVVFVILTIFAVTVAGSIPCAAQPAVTTVDFIENLGTSVNAAGPVLVQLDAARNRLIAANTLTSSLSVIDCSTGAVTNIPLGGRAFQHLKSEAMTINRATGGVCLIGDGRIFVVDVEAGTARTIKTDVQFESIAVDEETGNVFVAGRESKSLGFIKAGSNKLKTKNWLDTSEDLINLNATPPPPLRKVIADNALGRIIAIDGTQPMLYLFDATNGKLLGNRPLPLEAGGRWHLAGYNEEIHSLYVVIELDTRHVVQAARIDINGGKDVVVDLPRYREGVGIVYNPAREEVYIPYDNHASVHVASFGGGGSLDEIPVPAYGNDHASVDEANDILYIGSWAFGEIDVIDLKSRSLVKRMTGLGIIPHMFTSAFNPNDGLLYFPKGASAVNGTFGAAITALDPASGETSKVYTGWAPVDVIEMPSRGSVFVFNNEDEFTEVRPDGSFDVHRLPYDYPVSAVHNSDGDVYLSYGPHQSYWPNVYIWDAKNGVLTIDAGDLGYYDRRIPRQAHRMALDNNGVLYFTQNNWGKEEQFVGTLSDPVRVFEAGERLRLVDEVQRETTQRTLQYDAAAGLLYLVRIGEHDDSLSVLQVIDPVEKKVVERIEVGLTATDLEFDARAIYVSNFDSRSVSIIDKESFSVRELSTDEHPLRLCRAGEVVYVLSHTDNTLQSIGPNPKVHKLPKKGFPDNAFQWNGDIVITSRTHDRVYIFRFDTEKRKFKTLHEAKYPYGDVGYDTRNVSFYVRGQYGDAVFETTRATTDADGRLYITDFLAGKLYIIESD